MSSPYNGESSGKENQNHMDTWGIDGFTGLNLSYYIGELCLLLYIPSIVTALKFLDSNTEP